MPQRRSFPTSAVSVLLVSFGLVLATGHRLSMGLGWHYPPVNDLVVTEHYLTDVGALLMGSHRLAADVAYIDFLQYYGEPGSVEEEMSPPEPGEQRHLEQKYPRLLELATRILRLDPYFSTAILEAAGALAYNHQRVDQALQLLREAIERDPNYYRYHLYVSAILYKDKGNDQATIALLLEAIKYPDCPTMFQLVLGNLLHRVGRPLDAARVYIHAYQTAHKDYEKNDALRRLNEVIKDSPEVAAELHIPVPSH